MYFRMKKFRWSVFVVCLFISNSIFTQSTSLLRLKSGNHKLTSNLSEIDEKLFEPSLYKGKYYLLVHFHTIPSNAIKQSLLRIGVRLHQYLPEKYFMAEIKENIDFSTLSEFLMDGVHLVEPAYKMSRSLYTKQYPKHAVSGNKISLIIRFLKDSDVDRDTFLQKYEAKIVAANSYSGECTIEIPISQIENLAEFPLIKYLEVIPMPAVPEDIDGQTNHRINYISNASVNAVPYNGAGVWLAMGDDGAVGPHIDYSGRMDLSSVGSSSGDHGDHVVGIMMGAGNIDPDVQGMAWGANVKVYDVWDAVNSTPTSYFNPGVVVTSTSYGNGCNAGYTSFAQTADQHIRQMPNLMHVFSAGNSGTSNCGYGAGSGWGNITGGIKSGKNVLAVGNVTSGNLLAGSSSRGPATDGRIKPDICANGTQVNSTLPNNQYGRNTGTSMAAPGVSGTYGALVHAYRELNNGVTPSSDLVKGAMLNCADDLGNIGPDFKFGWGRLNARRVLKVFENQTYELDSISQGGNNTHTITIPPGVEKVKVMVYWNDYEGAANAAKALVNDLNMTVNSPASGVMYPYLLDPTPNSTTLNLPAVNGVDSLNNMEQIVIDAPLVGNYSVSVNGFNIPQGPQKYYLIYEFITSEVVVTYPIGGEGFVPGTTEVIRWDAITGTQNFQIDYSIDNGQNWIGIATASASSRQANFFVPNLVSGQAKVRVTRNSVSGESNSNFSIIGVPENIEVVSSCPNDFDLKWNVVPGATSYEVSVLGSKYMDSVITVNDTAANIAGFSAAYPQWVSVRAKTIDAIGKRAVAIQKDAGIWNCLLNEDIGIYLVSPQVGVLPSCEAESEISVVVLLKNMGATSVTNVNMEMQFINNSIVSESFYGVILPGDSVYYTLTRKIPNLNPGQNVNFSVWKIDPDDNFLNDSITSFFREESMLSTQVGYATDFQDQINCSDATNCGQTICPLSDWENASNGLSDDIDFRTKTGSTTSSNTGPSAGHTDGSFTDKYLYLEASGSCDNRKALLYSPCFDLTQAIHPHAKIWYHMNGVEMGELHFDVYANSKWFMDYLEPISGNQGNSWRQADIDLSLFAGSSNVIVRYRGITGVGYRSDLALDDFELVEEGQGIVGDSIFCMDNSGQVSQTGFSGLASFSWDFGPDANPSSTMGGGPHNIQFSASGSKVINLTVVENGTSQSFSRNVVVAATSQARFDTSQIINNQIQFFNTTPGAISSSWNFGDGGLSKEFNEVHTYASDGLYDIELNAVNVCGTSTVNKTIHVGLVGVNGLSETSKAVVIYPNPSNGVVVFSLRKDFILGRVKITDVKGSVVFEREQQAYTPIFEVDLSQLNTGVYIVEITSEEETIQDKLVIR